MTEFELIAHMRDAAKAVAGDSASILLGSGDDCALLQPAAGTVHAVSVDTAVADVHFPAAGPAEAIGCRAAAAALSDLAAVGAVPTALFLALTLPPALAQADWCAALARGVASALRGTGAVLAGGDLTRGPLTISCTVIGDVPPEQALRRDGARTGDRVFVSGALGAAAAALRTGRHLEALPPEGDPAEGLGARYWRPQPRIALGQGLRGIASAAIDVSDGLVADLGHIAAASAVDISLDAAFVPVHPAASVALGEAALGCALHGGDDYEIAFCAPRSATAALRALAARSGVAITAIGEVTGAGGRVGVTGAAAAAAGFDHFRTAAP